MASTDDTKKYIVDQAEVCGLCVCVCVCVRGCFLPFVLDTGSPLGYVVACLISSDFLRAARQYARFMRKAMSKPECIDADGNLNMEYFRPKVLDNITWTDDTIHDLIEGIKRHGVGQWSQIQADFLPMLVRRPCSQMFLRLFSWMFG